MYTRKLTLENENNDSVFLWGARQVGKSTFLQKTYPESRYYDLLDPGEYERLLRNPSLLMDELESFSHNDLVIIDEIQKIPSLLNIVHSLIQKKNIRFILSGSSPRKIKRIGANLLGGRALKRNMYPLVSAEIPDFNINKAINNGMIPRHYMASNPWDRLSAYIGIYLKEEIREEAFSRNLHSFTRFIEVAAMSNGEMIVYKNIAQDCGIDYRTVKEYFEILQDTLFGYLIPGFTDTVKRKAIQAPKFYYYDVGIVNFLLKRKNIEQGTVAFGNAFEHFIIQELIAYISYNIIYEDITYWRSKSGYEVDCIVGKGRIAIEIKSTNEVKSRHLKGLKAFSEDFPNARTLVVSLDKYYRKMNEVEIFPVINFLNMLWEGKII